MRDRDSRGAQRCDSGVRGSQLPQGGWRSEGRDPAAWVTPCEPCLEPWAAWPLTSGPKDLAGRGSRAQTQMLGAPRAEVDLGKDSPLCLRLSAKAGGHHTGDLRLFQASGGHPEESPLLLLWSPPAAACSWPPWRKAPSRQPSRETSSLDVFMWDWSFLLPRSNKSQGASFLVGRAGVRRARSLWGPPPSHVRHWGTALLPSG